MPQDHKLWDAALWEVQSHILFAVGQAAFTRPQKNALLAIYVFCRDRIESGPPSPSPTNRELASKYGVSLRTVTNWRREGCPFNEGQVKVLDWLTERRYAPARTRAKFSEQLAKRKTLAFLYRPMRKAMDEARDLKRDYLNDGLEPPSWLKMFRATRRTKGMPTGKRPKRQQKGKKPGKPRRKVNYGLKFLVEASKVAAAMDSE